MRQEKLNMSGEFWGAVTLIMGAACYFWGEANKQDIYQSSAQTVPSSAEAMEIPYQPPKGYLTPVKHARISRPYHVHLKNAQQESPVVERMPSEDLPRDFPPFPQLPPADLPQELLPEGGISIVVPDPVDIPPMRRIVHEELGVPMNWGYFPRLSEPR